MNKRKLAAKFVSKPVAMFDMLNYGARFARDIELFFGNSPQFETRMPMHEFVAQQNGNVAIDYLEFGVWQGETFKKWLSMNSHSDSKFYGFDSFEGLPEDWEAGQPKGTFSTGGKVPEVSDTRAEFVVGWFNKTLYGFLENKVFERPLVVHLDCDLYSSTLFVLAALDRHFPKNTVIIFDEYGSLTHEFAAWLDYRRSFGREWEPLARTTSGGQTAIRLIS